jgi:hypothetical protein
MQTSQRLIASRPEYTLSAKLKGVKYVSDQSKLLVTCLSVVGVLPSQLTIILGMLDELEDTFQATTVKNLTHKCELLHQKELRIDHNMSTSEKYMEFLARYNYQV